MSAFSTLYISRSKARALLLAQIEKLPDDQLEKFINELVEPQLYRVSLAGDINGNDDDQLDRTLST